MCSFLSSAVQEHIVVLHACVFHIVLHRARHLTLCIILQVEYLDPHIWKHGLFDSILSKSAFATQWLVRLSNKEGWHFEWNSINFFYPQRCLACKKLLAYGIVGLHLVSSEHRSASLLKEALQEGVVWALCKVQRLTILNLNTAHTKRIQIQTLPKGSKRPTWIDVAGIWRFQLAN